MKKNKKKFLRKKHHVKNKNFRKNQELLFIFTSMKKTIAILLMSLPFVGNSQTINPVKHEAYISPSTSWSPNNNLSYSVEAGTWGIVSNTSFGVTFDAVPNAGKFNYYLGGKAYYTVHNEDKLCYMVYVAPKFNVNDQKDQIIEFGFNPNYTLSKSVLFGVTLGNQVNTNSQWNWFIGGGFVFLLKK